MSPSILVVEDEDAIAVLLQYNLEKEGFHVIRAADGEEALLLAEEHAPDLAVLDWMMPKISGVEVCRRLRTRPETRSLPIIMLTARTEEADKIRLLYGGSVNDANAAELLGAGDVDGALVGGASLTAAKFTPIIEAAGRIAS